MAYTHHLPTAIQKIDHEIVDFIQNWVNSDDVRRNTVLVIFSDHGNCFFSSILDDTSSRLFKTSLATTFDQRNPFMYILIPPWMKKKYPERVKSLETNSKERVTTHIDLYWTLSHLLNFDKPTLASSLGIGQSLFAVIPKNRSCEDMGIPTFYCSCKQPVDIDPRYMKEKVYLHSLESTLKPMLAKTIDYR
jgi:membrane-anchored protein YejM (alkaline phosphatase superfamily)